MTAPADRLRRVVDVVVGVAGLIVLSPVMVALAAAIRWRMGPRVVFRQKRQGIYGTPILLLKFRSMKHAAPGREAPEFDAERITPLGAFLRSTSLDELPSLWNLIRGEITLVGPRPLPVQYWERYRGDEYRRFDVKPGLTGLAQVSGRNRVDWPERLALDVKYVAERSLMGDLRILWKTIGVVLRRSGVANENAVTMYELPVKRP